MGEARYEEVTADRQARDRANATKRKRRQMQKRSRKLNRRNR